MNGDTAAIIIRQKDGREGKGRGDVLSTGKKSTEGREAVNGVYTNMGSNN
jgi:hypothetical protein